MGRKGARRRIARCVYEDGTGRAGIYRDSQGRPRELRFPPHTPVREIREALETEQRKHPRRRARVRGTLDDAIAQWTRMEQHLESWKERRAELRAWAALYGPVSLARLTDHDVRRAMSVWSTQQPPVSPKTIRNRLWTLKHLFHVIYGKNFETPVDHIEPPAKVRQIINPTSAETILRVYQNLHAAEARGYLRDAKTRARFMVRAASGRRPIEIMRAKPDDVDLERRIWRVRDAKGGWSEGLYLHDELKAAWELFIQADAWGDFNTGSMAKVLRSAGWPKGVRPYNLRHSVGISLSESGVDFADVAGYLGHRDVRTTRESYVPVLNSRMERAGKLLDGRLNGWSVPRDVPSPDAPDCSNLHQTGDRAERKKRRQKRDNR